MSSLLAYKHDMKEIIDIIMKQTRDYVATQGKRNEIGRKVMSSD